MRSAFAATITTVSLVRLKLSLKSGSSGISRSRRIGFHYLSNGCSIISLMSCQCEKTSQSENPSPGPVEDAEVLVRLAFHPEMIDEDGRLKNSAIPSDELRRQVDGEAPLRGCSVFRIAHTSDAQIGVEAANLSANRAQRSDAFKFHWSTRELRELIADDGRRSVCVVDRAELHNISHAELWGGKAGRSKGALKSIRDQLISILVPMGRIESPN